MRAIAEEAFAMVREYKGSHSGEHGDGLVRSEFHEPMFGARLVRAFEEVKDRFDPKGLLNPGKIVRAPKFDDRSCSASGPAIAAPEIDGALDWSAYPGAGGGFQGAVEMCNNNGACRKLDGGVMCPSYRVTRDERDVTRGRANSLRLAHHRPARAGRAHLRRDGRDAEALRLLQGLPARMPDRRRHGAHEDRGAGRARREARAVAARPAGRLPAALCAAMRRKLPWLLEPARHACPGAARTVGSARAASARGARCRSGGAMCSRRARRAARCRPTDGARGRAVRRHLQPLFRAREPRRRRRRCCAPAATACTSPSPPTATRPLCCGRTFLSVGMVDEARREAERVLAALAPFVARGVPVVGLEPSCILGFRDEIPAMIKPRRRAQQLADARAAVRGIPGARGARPAGSTCRSSRRRARARCTATATRRPSARWARSSASLKLVPGLEVETVEFELLRHGRRLRLRRRHHRRVARDGRAVAAAGRAQGRRRHAHRRRRHLLPPPDPRRRGATRCMSRACWR